MKARGFTLVELVVTVAIVALIATAAMPVAELAVRRVKEAELRQALRQLRTGIDAYKAASDAGRVTRSADATGYPPTLDELVKGVIDAKDPKHRRIFFMRRLPADPLYDGPETTPADTWGKRSYDSPPESPQAGKDVYDVYSQASGTGLNGAAYRLW